MPSGLTKSNSSSLAYAQTIVISAMRYTLEQQTMMPKMVEKFTLGKGEKQIIVPKAYAFSDAVDLQEGIDIEEATQVNNTYTTLSTYEIGKKCILTDKLIRQMNDDVLRMVGRLLGDSMARKVEKDGLTQIQSFSNYMGATTTAIHLNRIAAGVAKLNAGLNSSLEPAPNPRYAVIHPYQAHEISKSITPLGTYPIPAGTTEDMLKQWWVGRFHALGLDIYSNGLLAIDSANDCKGGLFSKSSMAYIESKGADVEKERDASMRAWELVIVQDSDYVTLDDNYGMYLYFACSTPTS